MHLLWSGLGGGAGGGWVGVNTLCFLTACHSRRLLASSVQSAVISLATGRSPYQAERRPSLCVRPQGRTAPAPTLPVPPSAALCRFPQFHSSTCPPPLSCLSPLLGLGKVGPSAVGRWPLFVTRSKSTTAQREKNKTNKTGWNGTLEMLTCLSWCVFIGFTSWRIILLDCGVAAVTPAYSNCCSGKHSPAFFFYHVVT